MARPKEEELLYKLLVLASVEVLIAAPVNAAPTTMLSLGAQRDVQCVTLALLAVSVEKDQTKQQGIITESWYFLGRLAAEAPGTDLKAATAKALNAMKGDPHAKDVGLACDAEFERRGADLRNLGG